MGAATAQQQHTMATSEPASPSHATANQAAKAFFDRFDGDGKGHLEVHEFQALCESMGRTLDLDEAQAALSALDFDEIRRRKKLPPPNPRPFAQHLVLESKIDAIERDLEARLRAASAAAEVDASGVPVAVA